MQHSKYINNISEIAEYSKENSILLSTCSRIFQTFNLWGINRMLNSVKERGISSVTLFQTLLVFPFLNIDNVYNLFLSGIEKEVVGSKNAYYRFLQNEWVPWRKILYAFARQFLLRNHERSQSNDGETQCLIVDDSTLPKAGKKIEQMGKVYDHCTGRYLLGYKGLFVGHWDGKSLIPTDFSLHQEPGNDGMCGLNSKQLDTQSSYERSENSPAFQRISETTQSKIEQSIRMIKRSISKGFTCEYVLADSWFMCEKFISEIYHLNGRLKSGPHILGAFKTNRKIKINQRKHMLHNLSDTLHSAQRHCKSFKCQYIPIKGTYKGIELKIFLVRMRGSDTWKSIATTNTSLSFTKAMRIYAIRWSIEVFFKDAKQHLNLGKSQSQNFNAQIAATTLCCLQYIALAFAKRHEAYETIGGMFERYKEQFLQDHIMEQIWNLINTIYIEIFADFGIHFDTFIYKILDSEKARTHMKKISLLTASTKIKNQSLKLNI